ncbi:zinc-finger domain-containing protein [Rossellomorea vietnamensis]|uniref:Zinc-finger domain-containing protein n=2 Tax=Rossellomorea TaxID=2837508 RepID=A0A5D4NWX8_9BACI|nr:MULTISPECIES: zinc-finger domain-containing protein [Rossellomorea]TYR76659.1 zinc-finger domain-containing protein [Rossellomorea vietnamensis]TYS18865.1 zinc-finger domain-containing protein [Rossellomorea vietnamensis]TYS79429.1 zinc-finger domain-containing protein [Rossellomorea aquimaris]
MERTQVIGKLDEIHATYCEDCLLKAHFRKEHGKTYAHRFCIEKCTVGQEIKELGKNLT